MWTKASKYHKLPSEIIDPAHRLDDLTRYQVDSVVTHFGITIENAMNERDEVAAGTRTESRPKYTLPQLLDNKFCLPARQGSVSQMVLGQDSAGGKMWRELPPEERQE